MYHFHSKKKRKSSSDFYRVLTALCSLEVRCCRLAAESEIYQNEKKRLTSIKRKKSSRKWGTRNKRQAWSSISTAWIRMAHPLESHICPLTPKSHDGLTSETHTCTSALPLASQPRPSDWCFRKEFIFPAVRRGEIFNWRVYRGANERFSNSFAPLNEFPPTDGALRHAFNDGSYVAPPFHSHIASVWESARAFTSTAFSRMHTIISNQNFSTCFWGFSRINSHKSRGRCTDVLPLKSITFDVILPTGRFGRGLCFLSSFSFSTGPTSHWLIHTLVFFCWKKFGTCYFTCMPGDTKRSPCRAICSATPQNSRGTARVLWHRAQKHPPVLEMGLIHTERAQRTVMLWGDAGKSNSLLFETTFRLILLVVVLLFQLQ